VNAKSVVAVIEQPACDLLQQPALLLPNTFPCHDGGRLRSNLFQRFLFSGWSANSVTKDRGKNLVVQFFDERVEKCREAGEQFISVSRRPGGEQADVGRGTICRPVDCSVAIDRLAQRRTITNQLIDRAAADRRNPHEDSSVEVFHVS